MEFTEKFRLNVERLLNNNEDFKFDTDNVSVRPIIDSNLNNLCKVLIKSARMAEKDLNICHKNHSNKKCLRLNPEQRIELNSLKKLKYDYLTNVFCISKKKEYRRAIKEFRKAQRTLVYKQQISKANSLEEVMYSNKDKFWKSIKSFRKMNDLAKGEKRIPINEFAKYYSNLFSHDDRQSDQRQRDISERVEELFKSIETSVLDDVKFTELDLECIIKKLSNGKSVGIDFISNEMLKFGVCPMLLNILTSTFNMMIRYGHTPKDFNTSLLTPIPKKGTLLTPSDYRPISVSIVFAIIFEKLILGKINFEKMISKNQFGYKRKTSCKHAYFVVNETINYYNSGGSTVHLASLDATKAFDKLWRAGLFYKLKDKINPSIWRMIVSCYRDSKIIVKIGSERSESYRTTEGVKQGGVLSPYLFNFFINAMLTECLEMNIGASIGGVNVSVVSYCDDILLLCTTTTDLEALLGKCQEYAKFWKMAFNPSKSVYMEIGKYKHYNTIKMGGVIIPEVKTFIYLGLPIGDKISKNEFLEEKMSKVEKSFYSLYGLGCKPHALNPKTISFIYKQFCQSIFKYGLENIHLNNNQLDSFNTRQNILIKRAIGISKYCKTTPLFQVLRVESMRQLYAKHKIFFYRQIRCNSVTNAIFESLQGHYEHCKAPMDSLVDQLRKINVLTGDANCLLDLNGTIKMIEKLYKCVNNGLMDSLNFLITNTLKTNNYIDMIRCLESFLNYQNYANRPLYVVYNWLPALDPQEGEANGSCGLQQGLNPDDSILGIACESIGRPVNY